MGTTLDERHARNMDSLHGLNSDVPGQTLQDLISRARTALMFEAGLHDELKDEMRSVAKDGPKLQALIDTYQTWVVDTLNACARLPEAKLLVSHIVFSYYRFYRDLAWGILQPAELNVPVAHFSDPNDRDAPGQHDPSMN